MKEDKKVPQLRFPEFTDAWKQRKLGEIIDYSNGIGHENYVLPQGKYELVTLKSINSSGKLVCSEKFVNEDFETLKAETLIMMLSEQAKGMLGMTTIIPCDNKYVLNQRVAALKAHNDVEVHFLTNAINNKQNYFEQMGAGTKVQNITRGHVEECVIELPSLEEQKKIGSLFSKLEVTITLQQRKLNSLQKLKKGLLQKMFPKNGENIPEIRFPEFSDAWKQRELGEIAERVTRRNSSLESQTPLTISAEYGLIDQNKFFGKRIAAKDLSNYYLIQKGEFAYNKSTSNDAPWGAIKRLDCYNNGALSTLYIVFKIKDNKSCYSDFLVTYYGTSLWHKGVKEIATEGARNHGLLNVSPSDFFRTKLVIPQDFEEQRKIGAFFTQLDNTITLQQRKLESLQKLKKGLLQQMFI